jgi:threonine efflux protein
VNDLQALVPAIVLLVLGAVSPGPSLAVVVRNTATGGRWQGLHCALGHGLGFGLYALSVVFGLAVVMRDAPELFNLLQLGGAGLLLYLGWQSFRTSASPVANTRADVPQHATRGFLEGFLTAVLNPKIALFFLAVFSSVLHEELTHSTQLAMALAGWLIDTTWYAIVALALSTQRAEAYLHHRTITISYVMGAIFIALAIVTLINVAEFWLQSRQGFV